MFFITSADLKYVSVKLLVALASIICGSLIGRYTEEEYTDYLYNLSAHSILAICSIRSSMLSYLEKVTPGLWQINV